MSAESFTVTSATVDLEGGQRLRVSRYTDPSTGRDLLTIARVWLDDVVGIPADGPDVIKLPANCAGELIEALRELADG